MLDSDLKPWLVEINLSPSLSADSPLDHTIKSNVIADTFNIVGVKKFDRRRESMNKMRNRMKGYSKMKGGYQSKKGGVIGLNDDDDIIKSNQLPKDLDRIIKEMDESNENKDILRDVAKLKYKDVIKETIFEYERKGNFVRIFPAPGSDQYLQYFHH